jgi:hypothetical protein
MEMKSIKVISALILAALPMAVQGQESVQKRGTDVLHYSVRQPFVAAEGYAVEGKAYLSRKEQGNSQKQTADLFLRGLEAGASYTLSAVVGDNVEPAFVTTFAADTRGRANLRFRAQGNGQSLGRKLPLPDILNPTTGIKELIVYAGDQPVARVQFDTPAKMSYLVKRSLYTEQVGSVLRLKANHRVARLKWVVWGLAPETAYRLQLTTDAPAETVETVTSDADGRLVIDRAFESPYDAMGLTSVSLNQDDLESTQIIGTELP